MVGDLVAFGFEALLAELVDETAQASPRDEHREDLVTPLPRPLLLHSLQHGAIARLPLRRPIRRPIPPELPYRAPRLVNVRVLGQADVPRRDARAAKRAQRELGDAAGQARIGVDGVVGGVEGREVVEGRRGQELPVGLREGVEGLAAEVGDVEVGDSGVFTVSLLVLAFLDCVQQDGEDENTCKDR